MTNRFRAKLAGLAIVSLTAWGAACAFAGCGGDDSTPSNNNDSGAADSSATDSGKADTGSADSGSTDSGSADSGSTDSGTTTDSGSTDSGSTGDGGAALSFATDIYPFIQTNCLPCHATGGGAKAGLLLMGDVVDGGPEADGGTLLTANPDAMTAYMNLVGVAAKGTSVPENPADSGVTTPICSTLGSPTDGGTPLLRVKAGDHANSLCWLKVESREADGGAGFPVCGEGMPLAAAMFPPLSQANVDKLAQWIDQGAKP